MKINSKQYAQVLYDLTTDKNQIDTNDVIVKFAEELKKSGQLKIANEIIEKFNKIWNEQNGIIEAEITSARELEKSQISEIENYIKEKYKAKKVVSEKKIDKSLKGGVIIKMGGEVMDGSVTGRLRELKARLLKA